MPIKTIVLPLRESDMSEHLLESGMHAAQAYDAHLDVLYVHPSQGAMLPYMTLGVTRSMREQIEAAARQGSDAQAQRLHTLYQQVRERFGVPQAVRGECVGAPSADFSQTQGVRSEEVARRGRLADLMLMPRPERADPPPKTFEAILRDTGRPLLMIPRGKTTLATSARVVIGWNGSAEAASALAASRAVLRKASEVTVIVSAKRADRRPHADDVVTYLKCHGIASRGQVLDMPPGHVGEAITTFCDRIEADLLVVGCYSRTRLQEMLLGGVTRHLIQNARIPVLMVH